MNLQDYCGEGLPLINEMMSGIETLRQTTNASLRNQWFTELQKNIDHNKSDVILLFYANRAPPLELDEHLPR